MIAFTVCRKEKLSVSHRPWANKRKRLPAFSKQPFSGGAKFFSHRVRKLKRKLLPAFHDIHQKAGRRIQLPGKLDEFRNPCFIRTSGRTVIVIFYQPVKQPLQPLTRFALPAFPF
ncbi:hypothetical protein EYB39_22980 [Pantoea agglomerans]|nr:hypothetical protein EYB39_22980 [Pantoea agglomerans]